MYKTKNLGLNITEMSKDKNEKFNFDVDLGDNFKAIDADVLTHRNISNCILEIPQRIKYTLENGTLTIKAGSVVIVPYGTTNENFTRIGKPVISEDGIASGFSESNYIAMPTIDFSKPWECRLEFSTSTLGTPSGLLDWRGSTNIDNGLTVAAAKNLSFRMNLNGEAIRLETDFLKNNTKYFCKIGWSGATYYLKLLENGATSEEIKVLESTYPITNTSSTTKIGLFTVYPCINHLNLKSISITAGEQVVYRPYLQNGDVFLNDNFKVYDTQFANGKFFVWVEVQNDITRSREVTDFNTRFIRVCIASNKLESAITNEAHSGSTIGANGLMYKTDTNEVGYVSSGVFDTTDKESFPIGICTANGVSVFGTIDHVFNGFGYIGSTIWVDKGVKGLIPDGINADGSLKNTEFITDILTQYSVSGFSDLDTSIIGVHQNSVGKWECAAKALYLGSYNIPPQVKLYSCYYNTLENKWYQYNDTSSATWQEVKFYQCGSLKLNRLDGVSTVSKFNIKQPFRAVDYNDYQSKITELETKIEALQAAVKALQG